MALDLSRVDVTITVEDVLEFCRITRDPNPIHTVDFMISVAQFAEEKSARVHKREPREGVSLPPVVPGMLSLDAALFRGGDPAYNTLDFNFGVQYPGNLRFGYETSPDRSRRRLFASENGRDALTGPNGHQTFLSIGDVPERVDGERRVIEYSAQTVGELGEFLGVNDQEQVIRYLALDSISAALFDIPGNPLNDVEDTIAKKMAKGRHPLYSGMHIVLNGAKLREEGELTFIMDAQPSRSGRSLASMLACDFRIDCLSGDDKIYHAKTTLFLIPESRLAGALAPQT